MIRRGATARLTGTALLLAVGAVLPIVFHMFPLGGRLFRAMHRPACMAGLLLGPLSGLVVGAGSPLLSLLLTGRPPVYLAVPMILELATYGVVAGLVRPRFERALRGAAWILPIQASLLVAMVAGRAVWLATVVWLAPLIGITGRTVALALGALGAGWIGIAIQLVLIPAIVRAIEAARGAPAGFEDRPEA